MTQDEALNRVLAFLSDKFPGQINKLTPSTDLGDDVLMDSLSAMELVLFIEQDFGIDLERSDLDHFTTPESIARLIQRKRS